MHGKLSILSILSFFLTLSLLFPFSLAAPPFQAEEAKIKVEQRILVKFRGKSAVLRAYIPQEDEFQHRIALSASLPFRIERDENGNELAVFNLSQQTGEVEITSVLLVKRRRSFPSEKRMFSVFFLENTSLLSQFNASKEFEKIGRVAKWVCENIEYDESYAKISLSPEEVLHVKRGTCDEFAKLFIALLQPLGLGASYEAGYAYDGERFLPHALVRIYGKEVRDLDVAWCEMPVDALHVKFASLSTGAFRNLQLEIKGKNPEIIALEERDEFEIISANYSSPVEILLKATETKGGKIRGKLEAKSGDCVVGKFRLSMCLNERGEEIYTTEDFPFVAYFCGEYEKNFSLKIEKPGYTCEIFAYSDFGASEGMRIGKGKTEFPEKFLSWMGKWVEKIIEMLREFLSFLI